MLVPQIGVRFKPEAADRFGLTPGDVRRTATTLVKGTRVGELYDEQKIFDVVVWGVPALRTDPDALRQILIDAPNGARVPLSAAADVRVDGTPNIIQRESASRRIDVTANVRGRNRGGVARDIEQRVGALSYPSGYHPEFLGE